MAKQPITKSVTAHLKIVLDIGTDLGCVSLEDAIRRARELDITDVIDVSGLEFNDGTIEVTGVFQN